MQTNARATEQWAFNAALNENDGGEGAMAWSLLPLPEFPNGAQYFTHGVRPKHQKNPYIVHNNWLRGGAAKEGAWVRWGLL